MLARLGNGGSSQAGERESRDEAWSYGFAPWPQGEVFRRLVDYEEDRAARAAVPRDASLGGRLKGLLSRDRS